MCGCGHEETSHLVNKKDPKGPRGACNYGHDHAMGGCPCPSFHSRRWKSDKPFLVPGPFPGATERPSIAAAVKALRREVFDAIDRFEKAVLAAPKPATKAKLREELQYLVRSAGPEPVSMLATNGMSRAHQATGPVMGRCERALLDVLASRHGKHTSPGQLAVMSGYSLKSSGFANALSSLRSRGLAEGYRDEIHVTEAGRAASPDAKLPTGRALLEMWLPKLGRCERELIRCLLDVYPQGIPKEDLSEMTGYSITSSGFANALSRLRTLELAEGYDDIRASAAIGGEKPLRDEELAN